MEEGTQAVTQAEATVTESAPVEEGTVDNSVESSEKTEITEEGGQDSSETSKSIPYERFKEKNDEVKELRERINALEASKVEEKPTQEQIIQEEQAERAKKILKQLGMVTREEMEQSQRAEKAKNFFLSEMNRLESKFDGSDGKPKFVPQDIAKYMDDMRGKGQEITDPELAYKLMHYDALVDAKAKAQKSSTFTEKQAGGMNEVNDARSAELEAAEKSGDLTSFLKKYAPMPK